MFWSFVFLLSNSLLIFAQNDSISLKKSDYALLKKQGKLKMHSGMYKNNASITPQFEPSLPLSTTPVSSCACWQQRDATWKVVPFTDPLTQPVPPDYRNDDGSSPKINMPFGFCLYGTTYHSVYINNNGNVSFGAPYYDYSAAGFPSNQYVMVAPFWGDVDTQSPASGLVYYKITPTHLIVQWDGVDYFDTSDPYHNSLFNTFQLIITDGNDPLVSKNNVSFCYKDMQWASGDVSSVGNGGVNGFSGDDATVGANAGNGINFLQFGTFNKNNSVYNGPNGAHSGINWLDNQSFSFNSCAGSNNVPPIVNGSTCDTILACIGDTVHINNFWLSPEVTQTTTVTATTSLNGFTVTHNVPGNTVQFNAQLIAQASNLGYNTVTLTATDNGSPAQNTIISFVVNILNRPTAFVGHDTSICYGSVQLNASGGTNYLWSPSTGLNNPNISNPIASPSVTTSYVVTVSANGCSSDTSVTVSVQSAPSVSWADWKSTLSCDGYAVSLKTSVSSNGQSLYWNFGDGSSVTTYPPNFDASPHTYPYDGTYTLTLTAYNSLCKNILDTALVVPDVMKLIHILPSNVFTPNGDNNNDCFQPAICDYASVNPTTPCPQDTMIDIFKGCMDLEIYDRWGIKIFTSSGTQKCWNGTTKSGSPAKEGTYFYIASFGKNILQGFVELIR